MKGEPMVDAAGTVDARGSAVLAFIDTIEETGARWHLAQNRDGSYVANVALEGATFTGNGPSLVDAIRACGHDMIAGALKGTPLA